MDAKEEILRSILALSPLDSQEKQDIDFVLKWMNSGAEIFRRKKPATPPIHFVAYFLLYSPKDAKILLVDHKKAEIWLPTGGHIEPNETPKNTVLREAKEELNITAEFLFEDPIFLTVTKTVGKVEEHTDVSLWYLLKGDPAIDLIYDKEEFHQINWFSIHAIPKNREPHLNRFIKKMTQKWHSHITWKSYDSSASEYANLVRDLHPERESKMFLSFLSPKASIIDIGCGSGRDAKIFSEQGYQTSGFDFSEKLIDIAKKNAPLAALSVMDMRSLNYQSTFDAAWANASLLHLEKEECLSVLQKIFSSLKANGVFYIKVKKGLKQSLEQDSRYNNLEKFNAYYEEIELKKLLSLARFTLLDLFVTDHRTGYETHPYIHAFCKKESHT